MTNEIAILMAAGKGERMRPITNTIPKPKVKVHGTSMIETVIAGLNRRGVKKIYVVVGYLKDEFNYLLQKYDNLEIIENTEYTYKNNISSIYAAKDVMGKEDCFLCEADLYVSDLSIFDAELSRSAYYGKKVDGHSDDWVVDLDETGRAVRIGKYGDNTYNMTGICFLKQADAKIIADAIEEAYQHEGHEDLFWDQIANQNLDKLNLTVHPVRDDQIVEIDSVAELKAIDHSYDNVEV